jgi:hypothetical protein
LVSDSQGRKIETEAAPIRYVAELLGVDIDSERAIRWLIALMVLFVRPPGRSSGGEGDRQWILSKLLTLLGRVAAKADQPGFVRVQRHEPFCNKAQDALVRDTVLEETDNP